MAPSNPKRPPRSPGPQAPREESELELPFDDDEVMPLQADDPRPQRVPQYPVGTPRRGRRRSRETGRDREMAARFDPQEYSDPGYTPAFLYVEKGPGVGQLVPMKQGVLILGRSSSSDLRLQHPSISRRHAQFFRQGERFTVRDLGSQNGTFVNRVRITEEVELHIGDEIAIGSALLKLRGSGAAAELAALGASVSLAPKRRRTGTSATRTALTAAVVGSLVAVLITLILVKLARGAQEAPVVTATRAATPVAEPAPVEAGQAEESESPSTAEASSPRVREKATAREPSAQSIATTGRATSASEVASKASPARESSPRVRSGGGGADEDVEKADVLARYEAGDVAAALNLARRGRLEALASRIAAFQTTEAAGQKALAERDTAGALRYLTTAFNLDQQLSRGWSVQGRELRKQLGNLHTLTGLEYLGNGNTQAARESLEAALKFDPANAQAKTYLARLQGAAAP